MAAHGVSDWRALQPLERSAEQIKAGLLCSPADANCPTEAQQRSLASDYLGAG
jgi:hypothetical protein